MNATSIGLDPDTSALIPIDTTSFHPRTILCEVIPNPPHTWLIRDAATRGCKMLDRVGILVNQCVIAIKLRSDCAPRPEIMRDALTALLLADTPNASDSTPRYILWTLRPLMLAVHAHNRAHLLFALVRE